MALIIIYMLFFRSGSFTFQQVWSIFLLLLGIVLLCAIAPVANVIGNHVRAAAGSLLVMFTWLVFADISHHSTLHPFVIFGIARISYEVPRFLIEGLSLFGVTPPFDNAFYIGILFFALLVFAILFSRLGATPHSRSSSPTSRSAPTAAPPTGLRRSADRPPPTTASRSARRKCCCTCARDARAPTLPRRSTSQGTPCAATRSASTASFEVHNKTELQRKLGA